jgi:preprotein translocase subunit SecE
VAVATEKTESGFVRFFRDAWSEMRKVVWPSQQETVRLTAIVVTISAVVGLLLALCDLLFTQMVQFIGQL